MTLHDFNKSRFIRDDDHLKISIIYRDGLIFSRSGCWYEDHILDCMKLEVLRAGYILGKGWKFILKGACDEA